MCAQAQAPCMHVVITRNQQIIIIGLSFFPGTVKEKKLPGIQILANSDTCSFFKDFSIVEIPRFIILDKNGLIINQNAMRPSDPKLKDDLLKYIR